MTFKKILEVDPSKECLKFLYERILSDNYRGIQVSQHNRYNLNIVKTMIQLMHDTVGSGMMKIRTKDIAKRPFNLPDEAKYAEFVSKVYKAIGRGTQDSIRKNFFVDFHRMGLIDRFNSSGEKTDPYIRANITHVKLTPLAEKLICPSSKLMDTYAVFSVCLDNLLKGIGTDMFDILAEMSYITLDEYTFFLSFARQELNGKFISLEDVVRFTKEYQSLPRGQKDYVVRLVKKYCNPENFEGDKTIKRDYHNWKNESQQIFTLLDLMPYFSFDKDSGRLVFMVKKNSIIGSEEDLLKLKRSILEKKDYFAKHSVKKMIGFELHHIVPLLWAKNVNEFYFLDMWDNMLYIDGLSHSKISQKGNIHVRLSFYENNNIVLMNPEGDGIILVDEHNVLYGHKNQDVMKEKNLALLQSIN